MNLPQLSDKNALKFSVVLAAIVYSITAYNSHGFFHADEHYQIIEFARYKLGFNAGTDLAWEFKEKIRPAFQPVICFLLLKICHAVNVIDPYLQAYFLRMVTAIFALGCILYFVLNTRHFIQSERNKLYYYFLSFFLWFNPLICVRFSSETWSGLLFLTSIAVFYSQIKNNTKPILLGIFFGLSFLFRFQMAIPVAGFILWLIFIQKIKFDFFCKIVSALFLVILFGVCIDTWFYEELVFSPWNYFYKNIIIANPEGFGTSPWYFYALKFFSYPTYFVGILIVLSLILVIISNPRSLILWCFLPFFIIHSMIPHKEERFLFPIIFLLPFILVEAYILMERLITNQLYQTILNGVLMFIFIVINTLGLIAMGQKSAGFGRMEITKYIHDYYGKDRVNLIYCAWANPYDPWQGLPVKFYLEKDMKQTKINSLCELNDSFCEKDAINLLVLRKFDKENSVCLKKLTSSQLIFKRQSMPIWIESINSIYKGFDNREIIELYQYPVIDKPEVSKNEFNSFNHKIK